MFFIYFFNKMIFFIVFWENFYILFIIVEDVINRCIFKRQNFKIFYLNCHIIFTFVYISDIDIYFIFYKKHEIFAVFLF